MRMVSNKSTLLSYNMAANYSNNLSQNTSRSRRKTKSRKKTRHQSDDQMSDSDDKSSKSSDESTVRANDRSHRVAKNKNKTFYKTMDLSESDSDDESDSNRSVSDTNEKCEFSIVKEDNDSTAGTLKLRIATRRTNSVPNKKPESSHALPKRQLSVIEAVSGVVRESNDDDGADHGLDCQCWLHAGKGKRQPIPMKINRKHRHRRKRNDSSYDSSRSRSQSRSRSRSDSRSGQSYSDCSSRSCSTSSSRSSYSSSHSSSSCGSYSCSTSGSSSGSSNSSSVSGDSDSSDSDIGCKRKTDHSVNSKHSKQSKDSSLSESYVNRSEDSNGLRINCGQNLMPSTPLSQPSSVSCESSCYSPAISINSPLNSMYAHKKRDPAEERQRLRSYRIPHLQNRDRATNSGSNSANTPSNKTPATATVAIQVQTDPEEVNTGNKSKAQSKCKSKSVGTDTIDASNGKKGTKNKNKKSKKEKREESKSEKNVKNHDNKRSKSQTKTKKSKTKKSQSRVTETSLGSTYKSECQLSDSVTAPLAVETNSKHDFAESLYSDVNRVINQITLNENCSVINSNEKITHYLQSVPHLNDTNHPNSSLESLHHEKASPDSGIQSQGESPHRHHSVSDNEALAPSASTSRSTANSQQNSRSVNTRKKQKSKQSSKSRSDTNSKKSLISSCALQTSDAKSDNPLEFQPNPVKGVEHLMPALNLVSQLPPSLASNPSNLAQLTEIFLNNSNPNEATMGANFDLRLPLNLMPIMGRNLMPYPRCHPTSGHLPFMNPPKREDDFELLFRSIKEQISQFPNNENEDLDFDSTDWRQSHHNDHHSSQLSYQTSADHSVSTPKSRKRTTESTTNRKRNSRQQNKSEISDRKVDTLQTEKPTTGLSDRKSRSRSKKTSSAKSKADKSDADKELISNDLIVQKSDSLAADSRQLLTSIVESDHRTRSEVLQTVSNDDKTTTKMSENVSQPMLERTVDVPTQNPPQSPRNKTSLSSSSRKHHKRKHKKNKHKSHSKAKESPVEVNPEFLSLMENLSKSFKLLKVSKRVTTGALETKSRQQLPTIFQFFNFLKNIKNAKKHQLEHSIATSSQSCTNSPKVTATKKSNKKKVINSMNQTEQTVVDKKKIEKKSEVSAASVPSSNGSSGANEQRLPLKKRHRRHIETKQNSVSAVNTSQSSSSSTITSNHLHSSPTHPNNLSDTKTNFSSNVDNHSNGVTGDMAESKKKLSSSHQNNSSAVSPAVQPKSKRSTAYVSPKSNALSESDRALREGSNGVSNASKPEPSVSKKASHKSNKCEISANKSKKTNEKGANSAQVVHSSADKQNGILSDENQMAIWDSTGFPSVSAAAPHNSKATASDRLSAQPINWDSLKAQNSIDETIEQCIRKYTLLVPDAGPHSRPDHEVTKRKKVDTKSDLKSEEKSAKPESSSVLSESVVSGVSATVCAGLELEASVGSCDPLQDTMPARSRANHKTSAKTHTTRKGSQVDTSRVAANVNKTTKPRDLKCGDTAKAKAQTQTLQSTSSAVNANTSGSDANANRNVKRKRAVNKTGFPQPRKRVRPPAEPSAQQNRSSVETNSVNKSVSNTVNGKRPQSATVETGLSVTQKKELSSNDTNNRKSSQPVKRCRSSERSDQSRVAKVAKTVRTRTSSEAVVNDKLSLKAVNNQSEKLSINANTKKKMFTNIKTPNKLGSTSADKSQIKPKPIRRASKASIDSVSSSDAYLSEQSSVTEAPVYMVTAPSKGAVDSNKNVMKIKPAQRNIPYKKVAYLKYGKYSDDSRSDRLFATIAEAGDSQSSQMSATDDSISTTREESKVSQKLIQLPELEFDMTEEYKLPYDIYYQLIKHKPDPTNHMTYFRIKKNAFSDVIPISKCEPQSCNCERPPDGKAKGCGHNCLNRLSYLECSPLSCPVGDLCDNQRIGKNDWSPGLQRFMTSGRGWGIRATEDIKQGDFILEYIGDVVSVDKFRDRMTKEYQNDQHHYCLNLDSGMVIDGYRKANEGRFVNHSCEPNCEMQKWSVNGYYRVGLFALRDILPYEELSYDYNFDNFNLETRQVCRCGSAKCRGYIGVRSQKTRDNNSKERSDRSESIQREVSVSKVKEDCHKSRRKDIYLTKTMQSKTQSLRKHSMSVPMKPLSHQSKCFIQKHRCFLLRNYEKLRRVRNNVSNEHKLNPAYSADEFVKGKEVKTENDKDLINTLMTLNSRSVRTRGLAKAESNEELTRTAKLIPIFSDVCQSVINKQMTMSAKSEAVTPCVADAKTCVISLSRRKSADKQSNRVDLSDIQSQIRSGLFKSPQTFEDAFIKVLSCPAIPSCETKCTEQISSDDSEFFAQMREEFQKLMSEKKPFIEDIMSSDNNSNCGDSTSDSFATTTTTKEIKKSESTESLSNMSVNSIPQSNALVFANPLTTLPINDNTDQSNGVHNQNSSKDVKQEEEIIRCICGILQENGQMIQCDKCEIWQHCDCVGIKDAKDEDTYLCEVCSPRPVPTEIPLPKSQMDGSSATDATQFSQYLTLCHNGLRIKVNDCVYLCPPKEDQNSPRKMKEKLKQQSSAVDPKANYILLRVTQLLIDNTGKKFVYGTHFLRPSETYHEPSRKFYEKEVLRSPIFERVPIEDVKGLCCVLDPTTYCKGRPKGFDEEDVYICEMRTDRQAKSFCKIPKANHFFVNTQNYAFDHFPQKLTIKRSYTPHVVPVSYVKSKTKTNPKSEHNSKRTAENKLLVKELKKQKLLKLNDKLMTRAIDLMHQNQTNAEKDGDCGKQSLKR